MIWNRGSTYFECSLTATTHACASSMHISEIIQCKQVSILGSQVVTTKSLLVIPIKTNKEKMCLKYFFFSWDKQINYLWTPSPLKYMFPRWSWPSGQPWSAEDWKCFNAFFTSTATPLPWRYIKPRPAWPIGLLWRKMYLYQEMDQ